MTYYGAVYEAAASAAAAAAAGTWFCIDRLEFGARYLHGLDIIWHGCCQKNLQPMRWMLILLDRLK